MKVACMEVKEEKVVDGDIYDDVKNMKEAAKRFCNESMEAGAPWTDKQFDEILATFKEQKVNGAAMKNTVEDSMIYFYVV